MPALQRRRGSSAQAIESVLAQEGIELELIVVDDHSEDDTAAVAESIRDPRLTRAAQRRDAAASARATTSSCGAAARRTSPTSTPTTCVLPGALRKLVDALAGDRGGGPGALLLLRCRRARPRDARRLLRPLAAACAATRPPTLDHRTRAELARTSPTRCAPFAAPRSTTVGDFDERLPFGVDYDMALRVVDRYRITLVPEFLYARRVHGRNTTDEPALPGAALLVDPSTGFAGGSSALGAFRSSADPRLDLLGFLRSRWRKRGSIGRAACSAVVLRGAAARARWRVWAPWAATLHRHAARRLSWWPLAWRTTRRARPAGAARLVYYLRAFPVLSETFIQREVAALRRASACRWTSWPKRRTAPSTSTTRPAAWRRAPCTSDRRRRSRPAALRSVARAPSADRSRNLLLYVLLRAHSAHKSFGTTAPYGGVRSDWPACCGSAARRMSMRHGQAATRWSPCSPRAWPAFATRCRRAPRICTGTRRSPVSRSGSATPTSSSRTRSTTCRRSARRLPAGAATDVHTIYEGVDVGRFSPEPRVGRGGGHGIDPVGDAARRTEGHRGAVARVPNPQGSRARLPLRDRRRPGGGGDRLLHCGAQAVARPGSRGRRRISSAPYPFAAVREKYAEADIYVLAAVPASDGRRDVTPNTVIEAMAMALPVVSTRSGAIPELIEDGVSGLLVPPRDELGAGRCTGPSARRRATCAAPSAAPRAAASRSGSTSGGTRRATPRSSDSQSAPPAELW